MCSASGPAVDASMSSPARASSTLGACAAAQLAGGQTLTEYCGFGRALSQSTLPLIGSRLRPQTGRYEAPGISSCQ